MRPWLPALLVIAAAFAGCADEGTAEVMTDDPEDDHDHGDHDHGNETVHHNTAPEATLAADMLNGTAPLLVNLTLGGSDADGDNLTWSLELNGTQVANGTALPASHALNLTAGNHTVVLTVSDGMASAAANLTIAVSEAVDMDDADAPQDMGTFWYDPATGRCDLKSYDEYGTGPAILYNFDFWVFAEDNGVPGLQVANNFLVGPAEGLGFADPAWDICQDGDQMVF